MWKSETLAREKVEQVETTKIADGRRVAHGSHLAMRMDRLAFGIVDGPEGRLPAAMPLFLAKPGLASGDLLPGGVVAS